MPSWRPNCLRGSIYNDAPHYSITPHASVETAFPGQDIPEDRRGVVLVDLQKKEGCGLGLTVSGGVDKGQRPQVSNLRPGSIAHRCDALIVGDYIVSVNGIRTANLRHEEIINLLKNAGTEVTLEVEYEIPETGANCGNVHSKVYDVILDKELSGFGLSLRGGMIVEKMRAHPLTVVAIRHGGPADREGSIHVGDRVLAINGYKVTHLSLTETLSLFTQCDVTATFTMSYDVAVMDAVEHASGPLLIEIDRSPGSGLGITLSQSVHDGKSCICVDAVQPMSIGDRSGALHLGDLIMSIDGASVESMSVAEASQLLKSGTEHSVQLEIIPFTHLEHCANRDILVRNSMGSSISSHALPVLPHSNSIYSNLPLHHHHHPITTKSSTISGYSNASSDHRAGAGGSNHLHSFADNSTVSVGTTQFGTLNMRKRNGWSHGPERRATSCMSIASSSASVLSANNQVCHTETVEVILFADHKGLGISLKGGVFATAPLSHPPTITFIEPRSAAEMSGALQEGDRILAVNGVETVDRTMEEVNHFLRESRPRCVLLVEFDVTESVTPSSGTYIVKLAKKAGDTGITVHATPSGKACRDSLFISDVRRGSVAHRTGSIQPGDKLLAINDVRLDTCTSEDAMHLLELPDDIVKLKLRRDDPDEGNEGFIIYTVELQRFGGPLGITISGTEDPLDPIIISELTPHGLAERTGAIHVGDRLLAVSGNTTKNKPLSEAIKMLQSAGDIVTLKIARPDPSADSSHLQVHPFALGHSSSKPSTSVDSAMESWDSSAHDVANGHHDSSGPLVLAVPQQKGDKPASDSCYFRWSRPRSGQMLTDSEHSDVQHPRSSQEWDMESDHSLSSSNREDDKGDDNSDNNNGQMDEWVKTLEELEVGSGSEMLRQIGMSLRQRSVMSLDRKLHPENPVDTVKKRSKSSCRVESLGSNPNSGLAQKPVLGSKSDASMNKDQLIKELNRSILESSRSPKDPKKSDNTAKSCSALYTKVASPANRKRSQSPATKPTSRNSGSGNKDQIQTVFTPTPIQIQRIVLEKSKPKEDFGFSLSDAVHDRGVYVSAVKKGSLAEKAGLRVFDRVLQVNKVKTRDFDCCLTVPLISDVGKSLTLVVCRNPLLRLSQNMKEEKFGQNGRVPSDTEKREFVRTSNSSDKFNGVS